MANDDVTYRTAPEARDTMPPGVPYIVGNEAAERFSFYGMKSILTIFMLKYLWLMDDTVGEQMTRAKASEYQHLFTFAVYFTPILGALLADIFWGKYRTIIWLSLVYCLGHGALALMGISGSATVWLVSGLVLISIGGGGIKPCVSAHVGDQFGRQNSHLLTKVFNYFYWSINLGAFASTLLTPWLLEWYGPHWAFGVPGVLMALATLMFWMGRHKFIHIPAGGRAFVEEFKNKENLTTLAKLAVIFLLFIAMFWACFDQTASSWIIQVDDMDRNWLGIEWLPSQIQALNPILVLTFIPLFTFVIYPAIDMVWKLTALRKIGIGMFLMAAAFGLCAVIQSWIDAGQRPSFGWQALAYVILTASEIMVSIVCLEFSYTQASKNLKSIVMSLFLLSVAMGNLFTAEVNHLIQAPSMFSQAKKIAKKEKIQEVILPGLDNEPGTSDDLTVFYNKDYGRTGSKFEGKAQLKAAADRITAWAEAHDHRVPLQAKGEELIGSEIDPFGNELVYTVVSGRRCRITSMGADKKLLTKHDLGVALEFEAPAKEKAKSWVNRFQPEETWLTKRKAELAATQSEEVDDSMFFAGGQSRLEGAPYFRFFMWLMLGVSVLFMLFAKFIYKPQHHINEESS